MFSELVRLSIEDTLGSEHSNQSLSLWPASLLGILLLSLLYLTGLHTPDPSNFGRLGFASRVAKNDLRKYL